MATISAQGSGVSAVELIVARTVLRDDDVDVIGTVSCGGDVEVVSWIRRHGGCVMGPMGRREIAEAEEALWDTWVWSWWIEAA